MEPTEIGQNIIWFIEGIARIAPVIALAYFATKITFPTR